MVAIGLSVALVGTLALGTWLRWTMADVGVLPLPFPHLRHAHSHLGYYGLLFPLAWLGWHLAGAPTPGRRLLIVYTLATLLACVGFVRAGYSVDAIMGSTVVGSCWLVTAWPLRARLRDLSDPLGTVLPGVVLSLGCVPPIALTLRTAPQVAQGLVSTFLAGLLLVVIVPSTLAAAGRGPGPWPVLLAAGALGACALGVWPSPVAAAGLLIYAVLLIRFVLRADAGPILRGCWAAVALGLVLWGVGFLPNTRPVALGAIHFLVLSPVLGTFALRLLPRALPDRAWLLYHALVGGMSGALVLQSLGATAWTWKAAAFAGSGILLWWLAALGWASSRAIREAS